MPPVGIKPLIPAGERPQMYALDRAVTGTGDLSSLWNITVYLPIYLAYEMLRCTYQFI